MSDYTWPTSMDVTTFEASLVPNVRQMWSSLAGTGQVVDLLGERWSFKVGVPQSARLSSGAMEAFVNRLKGGSHRAMLWHMAREAPIGTLRGAPTLAATAAQGAASISVTGTVGATLKAGDMLGLSGMLLQVSDDVTFATSTATVPLVTRLRKACTSGLAITWDKPTIPMKLTETGGIPVRHSGRIVTDLQLEFLEDY